MFPLNYKSNPILLQTIKNQQTMTKQSILNQKLLFCLLLMIVGTCAGRIGTFMEPNCHKYRLDGSCECCSFRFWMTPDGCCKQVSDQCKDWCPITGKCTCCYLGYLLDNGCCVIPCEKPTPKCEEPPKKCVEPAKKWQGASRKWQAPSNKWAVSVKKGWVPEKPSAEICIEPQSCESQKSCESSKSQKSCKSSKNSKQCKSSKKSKQCKSSKKTKKTEKKVLKDLKNMRKFERGSIMSKKFVAEPSRNNMWKKPAGLRTNYRN